MKAKELIKLLYNNPHMDVAFRDEWGTQDVGSITLVKVSSIGVDYSDKDLQLIREYIANYNVEAITKEYNEILIGNCISKGHTLDEAIDMWGTLESHLELCHGGYIRNQEIIAECDAAEYTILLVAE